MTRLTGQDLKSRLARFGGKPAKGGRILALAARPLASLAVAAMLFAAPATAKAQSLEGLSNYSKGGEQSCSFGRTEGRYSSHHERIRISPKMNTVEINVNQYMKIYDFDLQLLTVGFETARTDGGVSANTMSFSSLGSNGQDGVRKARKLLDDCAAGRI